MHTEEWKITGVPVGSSLRHARLVIFEAASTRITHPDILQALRLGKWRLHMPGPLQTENQPGKKDTGCSATPAARHADLARPSPNSQTTGATFNWLFLLLQHLGTSWRVAEPYPWRSILRAKPAKMAGKASVCGWKRTSFVSALWGLPFGSAHLGEPPAVYRIPRFWEVCGSHDPTRSP